MRKNKGITLIALVVTIIVLLILATVSIATLTGENGILTQANKAKVETRGARVEEECNLWKVNKEMDSKTAEGTAQTLDELLDSLEERKLITAEEKATIEETGEITIGSRTINFGKENPPTVADKPGKPDLKTGLFTVSSTIDGKEGSSTNPTIPEGFKPVDEGDAKWGNEENGPTKNAVNEGLVIEDKDGNQFVWVPCGEGGVTYERKNGLTKTWNEKNEGGTAYKSKQYQYVEYNDWEDNGGDEISVDTYGGFYIGRYEAGIPTTGATFYTNGAGRYISEGRGNKEESTSVAELKPVSRKNHPSWNLITQKNALKVSSNMYSGNSAVTSSLIDSYAWDTVVEWIKTGEGAVNKVTDSKAYGNYRDANINLPTDGLYALHAFYWQDSIGKGWCYANNYFVGKYTKAGDKQITSANLGDYEVYDWSVAKSGWDFNTYTYKERLEIGTGAIETTKTKNIYDLAGNMWEWTTEVGQHHTAEDQSGTTEYAVNRGGSFNNAGTDVAVCNRNGDPISDTHYNIDYGFRVVLYLQ